MSRTYIFNKINKKQKSKKNIYFDSYYCIKNNRFKKSIHHMICNNTYTYQTFNIIRDNYFVHDKIEQKKIIAKNKSENQKYNFYYRKNKSIKNKKNKSFRRTIKQKIIFKLNNSLNVENIHDINNDLEININNRYKQKNYYY